MNRNRKLSSKNYTRNVQPHMPRGLATKTRDKIVPKKRKESEVE